MKTRHALVDKRVKHISRRQLKKTKAHHVDIVWILLWVFLLIFMLITIGIFFASIQPSGSVLN